MTVCTSFCDSYAKIFSALKEWPQYKYVSRPVYKMVAKNCNTVAAVAASFFVTDLLVHQMLPQLGFCAVSLGATCNLTYSPYVSAVWICLAIPVMISKFYKS